MYHIRRAWKEISLFLVFIFGYIFLKSHSVDFSSLVFLFAIFYQWHTQGRIFGGGAKRMWPWERGAKGVARMRGATKGMKPEG